MSITHLLIFVGLSILLTIVSALVVQHSIGEALKGLKLALKSEFTSNVGKLNLIAMILFVLVIVVFNLHEMIADALTVDSASRTENRVIAPGVLVGLLFIGSLICVMVVDKKKE